MKRKQAILFIVSVLLLAFITPVTLFYFATKIGSPKQLMVSAEPSEPRATTNPDSSVTILITGEDQFVFFKDKSKTGKGTIGDVRSFLVREDVSKKSFKVVIVSLKETYYKSVVDILDEMQINDIKKYAIVDVTKEDIDLANQVK